MQTGTWSRVIRERTWLRDVDSQPLASGWIPAW